MRDFIALVTSHEWRDELATLLLGEVSDSDLEGRTEMEKLALRWFFNGDIDAGIKYYVDRDKPVPAFLGKAVLESRKRKKGGRHSNPKQRAIEQADHIAAGLAVDYLIQNKGLRPTPAGEQVGKLMNLSRQACVEAWQRYKK